jgi:hypothetical protein
MRAEVADPAARQGAWSEHLRAMFLALDIPQGNVTDHLADSVAQYCNQYHSRGVHRSDLALLLARAFCAINDRDSASRVLGAIKPHALHVDRWLEILSELHHFPALLPYFSRGIIRPADWLGAELDRMWTLDLGRLALTEAEKHEIMLYRSLRSILENMYVFWDATQGEGVLGLKGLEAFNIESSARKKMTFTSADDLLGYIARLLMRQKDAREWKDVPRLMSLDL